MKNYRSNRRGRAAAFAISLAFSVAVAALAAGNGESRNREVGADEANDAGGVVATTSWTAAFAYAAGVSGVTVLAPYEVRHPPEYEITPSDLAAVADAEFVIYAGYERMIERIKGAVGGEKPRLLQIVTDYSLETIGASLNSLVSVVGSADAAERSIREIEAFYDEWRAEVTAAGILRTPVVAHAFHRPIIEAIGGTVVGVFGPAPLEARQIDTLSRSGAGLVVDNYHNDVGKPLRETMNEVPVVEFINFPGEAGTVTLLDVLEENRRRLRSTYENVNGE